MDDKTRAIITAEPHDEAALLANSSRQGDIATALMEQDPRLSFISAFIIAGDRLSYERAHEWVKAGATPIACVPFVGSFYRLAFVADLYEQGLAPREWVLEDWPDLWSGSDPDDTDPRFLRIWYEAKDFAIQKGKGIYARDHDEDDLPSYPHRQSMLKVYRGQDPDAPLGWAWSLDRDVAERFARGAGTRQSNRQGIVVDARIHRIQVLGYMTGRGEQEVIIDATYFPDWPVPPRKA